MNEKMDLAKKIIVTLDVGSREEALLLIRQLDGVEIFKVLVTGISFEEGRDVAHLPQ